MTDLVLAWRGLTRSKAFTTVAILTLTVGIAATTVMFAMVEAVLLRPLPMRDQDRLIVGWKELRSSAFAHYPFGGPDVEAVAQANGLFEASAGVTSNGATSWIVTENGSASYVTGAIVTGGFFDVLGVAPALGRALAVADDTEGAEKVVVISHGLWLRRYGGSRDVIGRRVGLGGLQFTIVGVMPRDVEYPQGVEVWRPVKSVSADGPFGDAARYELDLIARMQPGATIQQAAAELQVFTARTASQAPPDFPRDLVPVVQSIEEVISGDMRRPMLLSFAAVALVLLVAGANAANLLLMRTEGRRREISVQAALGAGHGRLVRQLLAESVLLAVAAVSAALAIAWSSLGTIAALLPDGLPRIDSLRIDGPVVVFAVAVALVMAVLTGVVPAVSAARTDLMTILRASGGVSRRVTGRRTLVATQIAVAMTVVALAGLLVRSLINLQTADPGFAADRIVFVDLAIPPAKVVDRTRHEQFLDQLITRLERLPIIAAATPVNLPPFSGTGGWDVPRFTVAGQSPERAATNPSLNLESVHPTYFDTFGIDIVRGRSFTTADRTGSEPVAIVSADVVERTWPGEEPIGKRLKMGGPQSEDEWRTVVGVAAPTRYRELERHRPTLYLPAAQFLMTARIIALRSAAPVDSVAALVRAEVGQVDPDAQVIRLTPFTTMLDTPLARPRFYALLLAVFGTAALALATIGFYGVLAASVRQRTRDIGIRIALGASAANVRLIVLHEAFVLAGVGATVGLAASIIATRYVRGLLFELDPLDPLTLAGTAVALMVASVGASYLPMRRAMRIDPATLLRTD